MDFRSILELFRGLSFRQGVWLFPLATALHFLEEAPRFANWARKYALPGYTRQRWTRIHGIGMAYAVAFSALVSLVPDRLVVLLFFALCFSQIVFNALFHASATAYFGVYCPGLISALLLYPPLFAYLSALAHRQDLLSTPLGLLAMAMAGVVHTLDVATSVFGVKLLSVANTRVSGRG